ncbi:NAD(P)/FAD-dependent oxidoreductase [Flavobacterium sp. Sd200]|uniref:FAD-dependent oxidoreductase n=1 Tax=Flavobacterium sp. Sd200 TaxID=2692211 RepID=UPI001F270E78|nr:NAD(P)/FAD-dependent oxidoreductase [Flavobacterium sp. Sd200]
MGKKSRGLTKKAKLRYEGELESFENENKLGSAPERPKGHVSVCTNCGGSGLIPSKLHPVADKEKYPHVAIIGGGIGGVALAVACLHRGIPFTLYERDSNFEARSQGYGLTLQQASKAMQGFGIFSLPAGVVSTKHVVHTTDGTVIGEWGYRKWIQPDEKKVSKHSNIHIARQSLRQALLDQLGGSESIQWTHQLIDFEATDSGVLLKFEVDGKIENTKADILVGADGIRSVVRRLLIGEKITPLRYLNCIVILGICPLSALSELENPLLDSATVFQTANGNERMYMMPFTTDSVMWQFSFPIAEEEALELNRLGVHALKEEACRRAQWHDPIPQILSATPTQYISGYPAYDRELLKPEMFSNSKNVTLIGDAAHPMSPFKGQGANQALLDALSLARKIYTGCRAFDWKKDGVIQNILADFESEMLDRSAVKVKGSAEAAEALHSKQVLRISDSPRGRHQTRSDV